MASMENNLKKYAPSSAFIIKIALIIVVILIAVGVHAFYGKVASFFTPKNTAPTATPVVVSDLASLEAQNGVPDWETTIKQFITQPSPTVTTATGTPNETDQFAQDLFSTAATLSEAGSVSDSGAQTIADNVATQISQQQLTNKTFTLDDVKPVPDSAQARQTYSKDILYLFNTKYPLDIDNSAMILSTALSNTDVSELSNLDPIILQYQNLIAAIQKLPVPQSAAPGEVELLNRLNKTLSSIELMKNVFVNPVMSMSASMQYGQTLSDLLEYISPFTSKIPYGNVDTSTINSVDATNTSDGTLSTQGN